MGSSYHDIPVKVDFDSTPIEALNAQFQRGDMTPNQYRDSLARLWERVTVTVGDGDAVPIDVPLPVVRFAVTLAD